MHLKEGRWHLVSLSGKNKTRLDDKLLSKGEPHPLTGEHTLLLSTKCNLRLRVSDCREADGKSA
ncbi:MAG: hypothetical protein HY360_14570 [Verrucomicrobia bacterium]|nr:hypothetical protein [Verrucomicrobiota bacterium]